MIQSPTRHGQIEHNELQRVVAMRESIKVVVAYAFRVNVLGLNAILLAKQFGDAACGFGVISNELRVFGRELREQMQALNSGSVQLVSQATRQLKLARQMLLMRQADTAVQPSSMRMLAALALQEQELVSLHQGVSRTLGLMSERVEAAHQSCLFGVVIARSARIEAAHSGQLGQVLSTTSSEFAEHVNQILPNLLVLQQTIGRHV
jgi:hypothetical protein